MRVSLWCIAAGYRYQMRFLPSIQLALLSRSRSLIECIVESLLHKSPAHPSDRGPAYQQCTGDLMVGQTFVCLQQYKCPLNPRSTT